MTTKETKENNLHPLKIGDYSLFKLSQEQKLREDKVMLNTIKDTVLHHWTRDQKDWVLRNLNFRLEKDFRLTENSIQSIKEWEETGKKIAYGDWVDNNPKYIREKA